jgi:hypothetical protein
MGLDSKEVAMARLLPRLTALPALAALAFAGGIAAGQGPQLAPAGVPGSGPPGGTTEGVTGNTPSMADQVDLMNRRINGEREHGRTSSAHVDRARPATAAEVIAGTAVNDSAGIQLGAIESVDAGGAVILTATGRARIPMEAFGHNSHGLLLQTTKAQFDASVAQANATPS